MRGGCYKHQSNKKKRINKERKVEEMDEVEGSINKKRKVEEKIDACMNDLAGLRLLAD